MAKDKKKTKAKSKTITTAATIKTIAITEAVLLKSSLPVGHLTFFNSDL